jgi:hypothetical protein
MAYWQSRCSSRHKEGNDINSNNKCYSIHLQIIIAAKSKDTAQGEGTIGIDNIKMLRPAGGGAATASNVDAATEDVCTPSKI